MTNTEMIAICDEILEDINKPKYSIHHFYTCHYLEYDKCLEISKVDKFVYHLAKFGFQKISGFAWGGFSFCAFRYRKADIDLTVKEYNNLKRNHIQLFKEHLKTESNAK